VGYHRTQAGNRIFNARHGSVGPFVRYGVAYKANVWGVVEYARFGTKPIQTFLNPGFDDVLAGVDASGNVYISSGTNVLLYPPGATTPSETIDISSAGGLAGVSPTGAIYATSDNYMFVHLPGSTTVSYLFKYQSSMYSHFAFDKAGNAYILINNSSSGPSAVAVYAQGSSTPSYTITNGVSLPLTAQVDASGNLYVLNAASSLTMTPRRIQRFSPSNSRLEPRTSSEVVYGYGRRSRRTEMTVGTSSGFKARLSIASRLK
jgi:hypothetical protein